jgi:hypothetical protein
MTITTASIRKAFLPLCAAALALSPLLTSLAGAQQAMSGTGTVSGVVREAETGRPIATARVSVAGTRIGTLARSDGRFVLHGVPAGDHALVAVSVGYSEGRSETFRVHGGGTAVADVELAAMAISIEGIVVTPGRFGVMQENAAAPQTMGREVIETMPGLGEDIYRMVHRLPGVAADDYSAKFAVRGGGHHELLVRLDGLTLFEPFHLKDLDGALSIVDVQAVGGVDLTTGGFTAEHGNRLTGVFDMRTLRDPAARTRTSAGISLTNARFMTVGGFDDNRGHWLVSARRGYLDVLLKMVDPESGFIPRYHDVLAKVGYELSPRHTLSVNVLTSGDAMTISDDFFTAGSTYGNHYAWLNWRAHPGSTLSVQTVASVGRLDWMRDVEGGAEGTEITALSLDDSRDFGFAGLLQDWSWRVSDRHLLKWGAGVRGSRASYEYERSQEGVVDGGMPNPGTGIDRTVVAHSAVESGVYATHRFRIAEPLTSEVGVRYDRYSQSREGVFSPRVNLAFALNRSTTLRAAWGLYHQPQELYQLHVQDGDASFYRAERAEHRVMGLDHVLAGGVSLRAEGYQRVLSRMRPRYDNLFNVNSGIEEAAPDRIRLEPTSGEARGIELLASSDPRNRLRWTASYSYASIEDVIDGRRVPRGLDQRHSALVELGYRPTPRWSLSSSWQMRSGRPYTSSSIVTTTLPDGTQEHRYVFGELYGKRLAAYHRLDLRATRRFDVGRNQIAVFVDVFNLYDRENPRGWSSSLENDGNGTVRLEEGPVMNLPRLPSLGVSWEF